MCGICGIYKFSRQDTVEESILIAMRNTLIHRGPDDEGLYLNGNVGLAMQRLKIIDLEGGHQPMSNEDGTLWLVYNGEVYNYLELREFLIKKGHHFSTQSDTEVILHLYEEYGENCVEKLIGMYAFALWDTQQEKLFLARDRLGIKPLFFYYDEHQFIFGSEIKAILATGVKREIDYDALNHYFSLFYVPTPHSIFQGIRKLPPGFILNCKKGDVSIRQYWNVSYNPSANNSKQDEDYYFDRVSELIRAAVRRQLCSDVPLGAFLSGGIDSSTVVAFMSELSTTPVKTFSIGFEEKSYNELDEARMVAQAFGTDHHELVVRPNMVELAPKLVEYFDEPFADYSAIPTYLVSQMAREYVTVALSGDGGDEIFAGYQTHYAYKIANLYRRIPKVVRRGVIDKLVKMLPVSTNRISFDYMAKRFVDGVDMSYQRGHFWWKAIFTDDEKRELFLPELWIKIEEQDSFSVFDNYFQQVRDIDILNQLLYVDLKTFLLDDNLTKVDRMSMANSIEVRVPLLDHELVEFAAQIPTSLKLRGFTTKYILRKIVKDKLGSSAISNLPKRGFTIPLPVWLQGDLKDFVRQLLAPEKIKQIGLFNYSYIQQLLREHELNLKDNNRQIWCLVAFVLWYDKYMLGTSAGASASRHPEKENAFAL